MSLCDSGARSEWKLKFGQRVPSLPEWISSHALRLAGEVRAPAEPFRFGRQLGVRPPVRRLGDPVRALRDVECVAGHEPQAVEQPAVVQREPSVERPVVTGVHRHAARVRQVLRAQRGQEVAGGPRPRQRAGVPFGGRPFCHGCEELPEFGGAGGWPCPVGSGEARPGLSRRGEPSQSVGARLRRQPDQAGRPHAPRPAAPQGYFFVPALRGELIAGAGHFVFDVALWCSWRRCGLRIRLLTFARSRCARRGARGSIGSGTSWSPSATTCGSTASSARGFVTSRCMARPGSP